MSKQQSGFTLIELVIVIVILGLLAATALPRFSNLTQSARVASLNGVAGSLRSAASIAHATQLVTPGAVSSDAVLMDTVSINMVNGWPTYRNNIHSFWNFWKPWDFFPKCVEKEEF